jgi:3-methyladenine DNA glycosylase AlkD
MTNKIEELKRDLNKLADSEKAKVLMRFFKTGKGDYGEGDKFLGIVVPKQRIIAKKYNDLSLEDSAKMLNSEIHEYRLTALFILVLQFEKGDEKKRGEVYKTYYKNRKFVNNWDLVDLSAPKIMGAYLADKKRDILYRLAKSKNLWDRRIAMLSTFTFIRNRDYKDTLAIAEILLRDKHDLIHKAVGWMLREIGKRDPKPEIEFLKKYHKIMPRVMWRYATERGVTI